MTVRKQLDLINYQEISIDSSTRKYQRPSLTLLYVGIIQFLSFFIAPQPKKETKVPE